MIQLNLINTTEKGESKGGQNNELKLNFLNKEIKEKTQRINMNFIEYLQSVGKAQDKRQCEDNFKLYTVNGLENSHKKRYSKGMIKTFENSVTNLRCKLGFDEKFIVDSFDNDSLENKRFRILNCEQKYQTPDLFDIQSELSFFKSAKELKGVMMKALSEINKDPSFEELCGTQPVYGVHENNIHEQTAMNLSEVPSSSGRTEDTQELSNLDVSTDSFISGVGQIDLDDKGPDWLLNQKDQEIGSSSKKDQKFALNNPSCDKCENKDHINNNPKKQNVSIQSIEKNTENFESTNFQPEDERKVTVSENRQCKDRDSRKNTNSEREYSVLNSVKEQKSISGSGQDLDFKMEISKSHKSMSLLHSPQIHIFGQKNETLTLLALKKSDLEHSDSSNCSWINVPFSTFLANSMECSAIFSTLPNRAGVFDSNTLKIRKSPPQDHDKSLDKKKSFYLEDIIEMNEKTKIHILRFQQLQKHFMLDSKAVHCQPSTGRGGRYKFKMHFHSYDIEFLAGMTIFDKCIDILQNFQSEIKEFSRGFTINDLSGIEILIRKTLRMMRIALLDNVSEKTPSEFEGTKSQKNPDILSTLCESIAVDTEKESSTKICKETCTPSKYDNEGSGNPDISLRDSDKNLTRRRYRRKESHSSGEKSFTKQKCLPRGTLDFMTNLRNRRASEITSSIMMWENEMIKSIVQLTNKILK